MHFILLQEHDSMCITWLWYIFPTHSYTLFCAHMFECLYFILILLYILSVAQVVVSQSGNPGVWK